jgi:C-terminal processing protease CtpA/Prc
VAASAPAAPYLSPGDRILAVNGNPINSMTDALNVYQQLTASGSTSVNVTMERGGQRLNVVYTIK